MAQELDIDGSARIADLPKNNNADSVLIVLPSGSIGVRDVTSLSEVQMLSISNDTIYLSNGSFVKLPDDSNAGWTMVVDTISTTKNVELGQILKLQNQNYVESASFGMDDISKQAIINDDSGPVDFIYVTGDTSLLEKIDGGIKIKKKGTIWISANVAIITTSVGSYTALSVNKNATPIFRTLIRPTDSLWDNLSISVPTNVNGNDIISLDLLGSGTDITNISGYQWVNFNFLWFSR